MLDLTADMNIRTHDNYMENSRYTPYEAHIFYVKQVRIAKYVQINGTTKMSTVLEVKCLTNPAIRQIRTQLFNRSEEEMLELKDEFIKAYVCQSKNPKNHKWYAAFTNNEWNYQKPPLVISRDESIFDMPETLQFDNTPDDTKEFFDSKSFYEEYDDGDGFSGWFDCDGRYHCS